MIFREYLSGNFSDCETGQRIADPMRYNVHFPKTTYYSIYLFMLSYYTTKLSYSMITFELVD